MKPKISKSEIENKIRETFSGNPSQNQIKKIRKLASSKNIKLKEFRKKFCKKCNTFFKPNNSTIRIKKPFKIIQCKTCSHISRYKIK